MESWHLAVIAYVGPAAILFVDTIRSMGWRASLRIAMTWPWLALEAMSGGA